MGGLFEGVREVETLARKLDTMLPPRTAHKGPKHLFRPNSKPQTQFLTTKADIAIYGGAAGGGKTYGLLLINLLYKHNPEFGAVMFRRTYPQITNEGGMWDESLKVFPLSDATPRVGDLDWTWPSGARVSFRHLMYEKELLDWMGAQINYIGWDQLEHFTEKQFWYMQSRNRSMSGIKPFMRATVNPDADSWVADLIAWWIDQETGYPIYERSGVLRWLIRYNDETIWGESREELFEKYGDPNLPEDDPDQIKPISLTFIPAKVTDNVDLMKADPSYIGKLKALGEVDRQRLLEGNWKVKFEAGKIFNRAWFEIVKQIPEGGRESRGWDFAATEKELKKKPRSDGPDYTASCKIRYVDGIFYVIDATADQISPADSDKLMKKLAKDDGKRCMQAWEVEPGAMAKKFSAALVKMLVGFITKALPARGDKYQRTKAAAVQAEHGNVKVLDRPWTRRWLAHMHGQPDLPHDDEHDAFGVAFNSLVGQTFKLPPSFTSSLFHRSKKRKKKRRR